MVENAVDLQLGYPAPPIGLVMFAATATNVQRGPLLLLNFCGPTGLSCTSPLSEVAAQVPMRPAPKIFSFFDFVFPHIDQSLLCGEDHERDVMVRPRS